MITVEKFKASTSAVGMRVSIAAIDKKLKTYNEVKRFNHEASLAAVRELRISAERYVRAHRHSGRVLGVNKLLRLAVFEEQALSLIVEAKTLGGEAGARSIIKCRDLEEKIYRVITPAEEDGMKWLKDQIKAAWDEISGLHVGGVGIARGTTDEGSALVMEDIHVLQRISSNAAAPGVLRAVLKQILSPGIVSQVKPMITGSGAKYNRFTEKDGTKKKYALNHPVYLKGGKDIRVGGLAHEMTHICVAETFKCTAILLAIPRDFTDTEIKNLAETRNAKLEALEELIIGDVALHSRRLERVKAEMLNRCEYGRGLKFTVYTGGFDRSLKEEEGQDFYDRLVRLGVAGLSSSVIEYDSVINQMLVWCHTHGLAHNNPVYLRLQELAGDELVRRQRAIPKPTLASRPPRKPLPPTPGARTRPGVPPRPDLPPRPGAPVPPKPMV